MMMMMTERLHLGTARLFMDEGVTQQGHLNHLPSIHFIYAAV